ncbi:MAG TPA: sigma-54 dependent transcriptional regulator [Spirochaetota bacterium]|jgi:two-component system nitrogen regulation response regulator NtrX|nr:sigma-54-dependent Fis family transcriptional regulator [Spirochaetota bacterium]HOK91656.1 sigma-54 dependent transcriptional regulator [Spirochaetota bacterium]HON16156.1 sigma-54 dependent transcriptional regulator [Spirochaetota bacterium]HPD79407.1 sigma-54 dependent transcriptional regulator [Spirochaetota bacterium]HPX90421.1 sigma-54 dependent transcriptional regulator [Spirochaetota bacterium]
MAKILIVDDEENIIKTMAPILEDEGHSVFSANSAEQCIDFLSRNEIDLAIVDVWLPDLDGTALLAKIKKDFPEVAVIMISGHGSIDIAVKSTRMGAFDFLEKPPSLDRLVTSVNNALEHLRLKKENIRLKKISFVDDELIGNSPEINEIREIIRRAARTNARVLITGESGTGKELVAKAIYQLSNRVDKPFIKMNCAAIPDELIESELFGHEKGAFTGALGKRIGKFELSDGGTLFLDEICDMSLSAQAKVLRVLQEQQFERVGGNQTITVDVRVIAATNVNIKDAIEKGKFREDLYYRLNVIPIHMPRLAERRDDIEVLANYFLKKFSQEHGTGEKILSGDAVEFLKKYPWPGNVRELKNIMERVVIMSLSEIITADDFEKYLVATVKDIPMTLSFNGLSLKDARDAFEREYIISALKSNGWNISETARQLDIERTNLHRKIRQLNIHEE